MSTSSEMDFLSIAVLIASYSLVSVWSIAVNLTCPHTFFNGENIVNCTINTTAIEEANCLSTSRSVTFDRTIRSQTTVVGMYNYEPNQACTPRSEHTPGSCWCSQSVGKIFTYSFSYLANSTLDQGGQLECKICILPENPMTVHVDQSCRNMHFGSITTDSKLHDTSDGRKQVTETVNQDPKANGIDQAALIGGITGAATIILIIITVIVIYFKKPHLFSWSSIRKKSIKTKDEDESEQMVSVTKRNDGKIEENGAPLKPADDFVEVHFKK